MLLFVRKDPGRPGDKMASQRRTLKQLIRRLHIVQPVEAVMCLIGKR